MFVDSRTRTKRRLAWRYIFSAVAVAAFSGLLVCVPPAFAAKASAPVAGQMEFGSPQLAFSALVNAAASNNTNGLLAIFGPDGKDIISSGDAIADTRARARFARSAKQGVAFKQLKKDVFLALVGKDGWTFPIPIIKKGNSWVFDTDEGKQEVLDRRIGRNELNTIRASLAYVEAQREYARNALAKGGQLQYAQSFIGQRDGQGGLYWPGREDSPLGPLFARAACRRSAALEAGKQEPYYGYYFGILKGQGRHAPGGAMDYVVDGKMTAGFGLVAYPAKYGVSGIMTFIVNQRGTIYEKDLGPHTEELAKKMSLYDPDGTWKKVDIMQAYLSK